MVKPIFILIWLGLILVACAPLPADTPAPDSPVVATAVNSPSTEEVPAMPYAPQPNDVNLNRDTVLIEEMGLLIRESFPPQITLGISGTLPTPCHELRAVIGTPDADNRISVEAYSVVDPNIACTQVIKPFHENIELGTYPTGHYSVWINEVLAGEFDS